MALQSTPPITLSDVRVEIYGTNDTTKWLMRDCFPDAVGTFQTAERDSLLDFLGYSHLSAPVVEKISVTFRQNTYMEYQIQASNSPTGYSVSGLPSGLSLNGSTGLISGSSGDTLGVHDVYLYATNSAGTGSTNVKFTIEEELHSHSLGLSTSSTGACDDWDNYYRVTRYADNTVFDNATLLYSDANGDNLAGAGYYSDGIGYRYWNGSSFTSTGSCPIF